MSLGDNKEGVLGLRVARQLEIPSNKPEVFTDASGKATAVPTLNNDGVNGDYLTSEGKTGDAAWGTRGKWCVLSGKIGADPVSIAIFDSPGNPGYPTYWHARGYGLFAANPLGQKDLSNGKDQLNFCARCRPERDLPLSHPHRRRVADRGGDGSRVERVEQQAGSGMRR